MTAPGCGGGRGLAAFRTAKAELASQYLQPGPSLDVPTPGLPANVVGVGIGERTTRGRPTGQRALLLLVRRKYPGEEIARTNRLPRTVAGLPVDVQEVGTLRALQGSPAVGRPNPRARHRPLRPGTSIGPEKTAAGTGCGTCGALVRAGAQRYLLTAGHAFGGLGAVEGTAVCQPSAFDAGAGPMEVVATVVRTTELESVNVVDAALARVAEEFDVSAAILGVGAPAGATEAQVDDVVHKVGRTTGYTVGRVISVDTDVKVAYGEAALVFRHQVAIANEGPDTFCDAGDSGALILHRQSRLGVGLLVAGGPRLGVANHLVDVLDALGVELVTEPAHPAAVEAGPERRVEDGSPGATSPPRHFTRLAP